MRSPHAGKLRFATSDRRGLRDHVGQEGQKAGIELRLFAGVIASDVPRMFLIGIAP
jgi:hypothetical protein